MKKGFTLVELLVVVLIIGILAAVAVPQYQKSVDETRFSRAMVLLETIRTAQNTYYMANGRYSTSWEDLDISFGKPRSDGSTYIDVSKNIYCYVQGTNGAYGGCAYNVYSGCRILHLAYWDDPLNRCYATADCERANKVCEQVAGTPEYTVISADNVYKF